MSLDPKFDSVKNIIEVCEFGFSLQKSIHSALEDGKVTIWDTPKFVSTFTKLGPAINDVKLVPTEIDTDEERALVLEYFKGEFDLPNDELEALIEDTLAEVNRLLELASRWKNITRKEK